MWHPLEDKRWRRRTIVVLYVALSVACIFAGVFGARVLAPAVSKKDVTAEVVKALTTNCKIQPQVPGTDPRTGDHQPGGAGVPGQSPTRR